MKSPICIARVTGYCIFLACLGVILFSCVYFGDSHSYFDKPYLTWQQDPCTTVTINFHSRRRRANVAVIYDEYTSEVFAHRAEGTARQIPGLADGRFINSVELTHLKPDTRYQFKIELENGVSPAYTFSTISDKNEPIRFAVCGDTLPTSIFNRTVQQVALQSPSFLVIGGDLAYANGNLEQIGRWNKWFSIWHSHDTTPDGRLIPLVMAIGNHEVNDLTGTKEERAPFFFNFFPQGGETYFARIFGPNLGMVVLDSAHIIPHEAQNQFIEDTLKDMAHLTYRVAVYHVPLYPSYRDYEGAGSVAGRTHWLPLFDTYGIHVGFEHHDHTFKRTKRLRNNAIHPSGTLYVGDGNAGVNPRMPKEGLWYMEKVSKQSHFWLVDITDDSMKLSAIDGSGNVFDTVQLTP